MNATTLRLNPHPMAIVWLLLIAATLVIALATPGCRGVPTTPAQLEALDDAGYARLEAKASLVTRIGVGRALKSGALKAGDVSVICSTLEALAGGVLSPEPGGLLSGALRKAGLTDDEALLTFMLVEDMLPDFGGIAPGPRGQALLQAIADTARAAIPTDEELPTAEVVPAVDYDAEPNLGFAPRMMVASGRPSPGLRRWVVPNPSQEIVATGKDGVYQKSGVGRTVADTRITLIDSPTNPARAGIIYDVDQLYAKASVHDVIVKPRDAANHTLWGLRRYGLEDASTERVLVRNIGREHGFYESAWRGACTWTDCTAINCAAQGFQLRLTGNRGDAHWSDARTISLVRFTAIECGQLRGAGRAGFSISVKDQGPNTDVLIEDALVRTVNQHAVIKRTDGTWADSFGGVCVEFCRSLEISGGYVEMLNPAKEAVQLFDYANNAADQTGPQHIDIHGLTIAAGGCIALRLGDADSVSIRDCVSLGGGRIKLFARDPGGTWRLAQSVPLDQGWTL